MRGISFGIELLNFFFYNIYLLDFVCNLLSPRALTTVTTYMFSNSMRVLFS